MDRWNPDSDSAPSICLRSLRPDQMVNQFPCESVLTCKDLLASVARRAVSSASGQQTPRWLPLTFNLLYELPHLVHSYLQREERYDAHR